MNTHPIAPAAALAGTLARRLRLPLILGALILAAPALPALAQSNPTADTIIKSLKPTGPIGGDTRGIRPVGAPPAVAPSVNLNVEFANGSDEITPGAAQALDELGKALSSTDLAGYHFRIEGHTDTVGSADYNKALSDRRAKNVAAYLEDKYKLDGARLQPVGMGEQGLLVQTPAETAEPRNRRVQIVNIGS